MAGIASRARNISRNGMLLASPVALEVGKSIALRVQPGEPKSMQLRGSVVRLRERSAREGDCFDVGVALDLNWTEGANLIRLLERAGGRPVTEAP